MAARENLRQRKIEGSASNFLGRVVGRLWGENMRDSGRGQAGKGLKLSHTGSLILNRGELCVVSISGACRVKCVEGTVWLTSPGRFSDYVLKAGESISLQVQGKIVISSGVGASVVRVTDE